MSSRNLMRSARKARAGTYAPSALFAEPNAILPTEVVIGILGWLVFSEQGKKWHKLLLYVIVAGAALKGFSSTMLEAMMVPLARAMQRAGT